MTNNNTTRELIILLRKKNPEMSQAEIARQTGVTRERVRQLINSMNLPKTPKRDKIREQVSYLRKQNPFIYKTKMASIIGCSVRSVTNALNQKDEVNEE